MRYVVWLLAALVLTTALAGCGGSDKDRGLYRNQDKPQEAPEKNK
jgi:hypothetical protein